MKGNRQRAFEFTIKEEGAGFTDTPGDRGGATKMGVTIGLMQKLRLDLNHDGKVDADDVRLVTRGIVENIFFRYYWDAVDGDNLPGGIDLIAADIAFNSGVGKWKQFQKEGYGRVSTPEEINDLVQRRIRFYTYQADKVPGQDKFRKGWLARADASGEEALKCVREAA